MLRQRELWNTSGTGRASRANPRARAIKNRVVALMVAFGIAFASSTLSLAQVPLHIPGAWAVQASQGTPAEIDSHKDEWLANSEGAREAANDEGMSYAGLDTAEQAGGGNGEADDAPNYASFDAPAQDDDVPSYASLDGDQSVQEEASSYAGL